VYLNPEIHQSPLFPLPASCQLLYKELSIPTGKRHKLNLLSQQTTLQMSQEKQQTEKHSKYTAKVSVVGENPIP
ncbi:TPA: hypothetical protein ACHYLB_005090, partial [Escherichia coli]